MLLASAQPGYPVLAARNCGPNGLASAARFSGMALTRFEPRRGSSQRARSSLAAVSRYAANAASGAAVPPVRRNCIAVGALIESEAPNNGRRSGLPMPTR